MHGDLTLSNIIFNENVPIFIDWEHFKYYDKGFEDYNAINASENIDTSAVKSAYKNFQNAYEMTQQALNYFMDSSMVEENENNSTDIAIKEMRRLRKNLKEIYIPSMEKISTDNNIELN